MNGRDLTLGFVGALALGAILRRPGGSADIPASLLGGVVHAGGDYADLRSLAYALKEPGSARVGEAADVIVANLPQTVRGPGIVLVPIPSSKGDTTLNLHLAEALAARIGATVVDALHGPERQSSRARKKAGLPGLRAQQMPMTARAQRQVDLAGSIYLVDNVFDTGETLRAAQRALGRPVGAMVLAVTASKRGRWPRRVQHGKTMKSGSPARDRSTVRHRDLEDALEHLSDMAGRILKLSDFHVSPLRDMQIKDLPADLSSWVDFSKGELANLTEDARFDALKSFRDKDFASRALPWIAAGTVPPIVIVDTADGVDLGDGRGRVNVAFGMGWDTVPVVVLKEKLRGTERARSMALRPAGSRSLHVPAEIIKEAQDLSRWFQARSKSWRAEDRAADREDFIGIDDTGLLLPVRMRAIQERFGQKLLGHGVWRAVVASADLRFVIKLAMRPSDNLDEATFWEEAGPKTRALLMPVVAVDPEGYWLIMERVESLPLKPEDHSAIRAIQRAALGVGLVDIHADNLSSDLRILDYAEPVSSRGTPNTRKSR